MTKKIEDERFALVNINLVKGIVKDYFTGKEVGNINKNNFKSSLDNRMLIKNNETLLVSNNGTQINFSKKINKEWEHFIGIGLGLMFPNPDGLNWEFIVDNCNYFDVNSRDRWGIGKKNKGRMWSDTKIVNMILKKNGKTK